MPKTVIEKIIIAVVSLLIGAGCLSLATNAINAASTDDLKDAVVSMEDYTNTAMKNHEEKESVKYDNMVEKLNTVYNRQEWMFLRELKKADKAAYIKELEEIEQRKIKRN
jgi:hypothetical protein